VVFPPSARHASMNPIRSPGEPGSAWRARCRFRGEAQLRVGLSEPWREAVRPREMANAAMSPMSRCIHLAPRRACGVCVGKGVGGRNKPGGIPTRFGGGTATPLKEPEGVRSRNRQCFFAQRRQEGVGATQRPTTRAPGGNGAWLPGSAAWHGAQLGSGGIRAAYKARTRVQTQERQGHS